MDYTQEQNTFSSGGSISIATAEGSPASRAATDLAKAIAEAHEVLGVHEACLGFALRPDTDSDKLAANTNPRAMESPLTERLTEHAAAVRNLTRRISELTDRVDLP